MENIYYVYCYYDTRSNPPIPIYVGRGKNRRYLQHYTKTHNKSLSTTLKLIKEETGLDAVVKKLEENLTNDEANKREIYYIQKYGRLNIGTGTLYNLTDGGQTSAGWKPSKETRKLWSLQRKGKKQTEAQYRANCSRVITEERKDKLRESIKQYHRKPGYKQSKEIIDKLVKTKVSNRPNLIGQKFGLLTVIEDTNENHRQKYICKCDCGETVIKIAVELKRRGPHKCNRSCSLKHLLKKSDSHRS